MRLSTGVLVSSGAALLLAGGGLVAVRTLRPSPPAVQAVTPPAVTRVTSRPVAGGQIRIGLESLEGATGLDLTLPSGGKLLDAATSAYIRPLPAGLKLRVTPDLKNGGVLIKGKGIWTICPQLAVSGKLVQIGKRRYPGTVRFALSGVGLALANDLDIEQYLEGVLPGEIPAGFGMEAQKALAVAARTYALVQRGKHGDFDLCDRTCCQMYLGYHRGSKRGIAAVRATRRQCLWSGDELVYAFYSADCGGLSTSVDEVPLKDKPQASLPYLRMVKDAPEKGADYCGASPYHQWTRRYTTEELERRLNRRPQTEIGKLVEVKVLDTDPSGRVRTVRLRGKLPNTAPLLTSAALGGRGTTHTPTYTPIEKTVTGWELRRSVGAMALKSTLMTLDHPQPGIYRFTGSGFGHGLGLCQIGADGMAKNGISYQDILTHYYPGARIAQLTKS